MLHRRQTGHPPITRVASIGPASGRRPIARGAASPLRIDFGALRSRHPPPHRRRSFKPGAVPLVPPAQACYSTNTGKGGARMLRQSSCLRAAQSQDEAIEYSNAHAGEVHAISGLKSHSAPQPNHSRTIHRLLFSLLPQSRLQNLNHILPKAKLESTSKPKHK